MPAESKPLCLYCRNELPDKPSRRGRPLEYCEASCRQAAYRERKASASPSAPTPERRQLHALAKLAQTELAMLVRLLGWPKATHHDLILRIEALRSQLTDISAGLVLDAREHDLDWEQIGRLLGIAEETASRAFPARAIRHRLDAVVPRRAARPSQPSPSRAAEPPGPGDPGGTAGIPVRAANGLAPVLSNLQRMSRLTLRQVALKAGVSASYLSRVVAGTEFPTWQLTDRLGRILGADLETLRQVWSDDEARLRKRGGTTSRHLTELHGALRALHQRAGSPAPQRVALLSGMVLDAETITNVLRGATVTWGETQALILALDGEPAFFLKLWEAASQAPRVAETPSHRLNRMIGAFNPTFASPGTGRRRAPLPHQRMRHAPIP
ncbi:helix-turn-helix domain-containing protein [Streptomyces albidoflavus]